jgi:hypothetical protein
MKLTSAIKFVLGAVPAMYLYGRYGRPWVRNWGAQGDEATMALPGDDILAHAALQTTRAITIGTGPENVWPWLVQMGGERAGAYTYDWIERMLGIDIKNTDRILPEFQQLEPGEFLALQDAKGIEVRAVEPGKALVVQWVPEGSTWSFVLIPQGDTTRLLSRNRLDGSGPGFWLMAALMEPLSLVMERKMLLGIKERAEKLAGERAVAVGAGVEAATWLDNGSD